MVTPFSAGVIIGDTCNQNGAVYFVRVLNQTLNPRYWNVRKSMRSHGWKTAIRRLQRLAPGCAERSTHVDLGKLVALSAGVLSVHSAGDRVFFPDDFTAYIVLAMNPTDAGL